MSRDVEAAVAYAGLALDRCGTRRQDPAWVARQQAAPRALVRPLWRDQCLVSAGRPLLVPVAAVAGSPLVLLGLESDIPHFAVDLSDLAQKDAMARVGADSTADIRTLFTGLPPADASAIAYARGLLRWHRHARYCGCCGSPTQVRNGGHLRVCADTGCGELQFPRIEPAVITLVESARPPERILLALHRGAKLCRYSLLAGFVEIGESLEDAVRREIREEVGIGLAKVSYVGSQPWPFPAGIMIAFRAVAGEETVKVDGDEISDARWFTPDELRDHLPGRLDSIDRILLTTWLTEKTET